MPGSNSCKVLNAQGEDLNDILTCGCDDEYEDHGMMIANLRTKVKIMSKIYDNIFYFQLLV